MNFNNLCFVILYFPGAPSPRIVRPWEMSPKKVRPTSPLPVTRQYTEPFTPPGVKPSSPAACDSGYYSNSPSTSPVPSEDYRSTSPVSSEDRRLAPVDYNTIPLYATNSWPDFCVSSDVREPKTRTLSIRGVEMMEAWYHDNIGHPYPSTEIVDYISKHGNVTTTQVRKWMANKRSRSCNTLTYNSTIHPKRLKRLQRDAAVIRHARGHHYSHSHMTKMAAHPATALLRQMAVSSTCRKNQHQVAAPVHLYTLRYTRWCPEHSTCLNSCLKWTSCLIMPGPSLCKQTEDSMNPVWT